MNTENRNIRFTSTVICRIFLGICCCFLAACSSQSSQNNSNIFLYAVDFSHSTLSPGNVKFDMSMEDVLQKTQLSEDDVDTTLGERIRESFIRSAFPVCRMIFRKSFLFRMINWYLWNMP